MDKKTKLWLGAGVLGVGAYLLWKSKKAAAVVTSTPAQFVGADSFASVGASEKFTNLAGVGDRMIAQDGTKFASVGQRSISADGGMINSTDVVGALAGSQNAGIFANKPFTGDVANMVGVSGEKVFANQSGKFFDPRTAKYGSNQGVFAPSKPKIKNPVEPMKPIKATQAAPLNNLVGQDGSRFFSVHDGFNK
jgi:hypothetical protein